MHIFFLHSIYSFIQQTLLDVVSALTEFRILIYIHITNGSMWEYFGRKSRYFDDTQFIHENHPNIQIPIVLIMYSFYLDMAK